MHKVELAIIFATYGNLAIVKQTLPTIIHDALNNNAIVIVHDSTEIKDGRKEKWQYLQEISDKNNNVFLLLSDNISMGHARNAGLFIAQKVFLADFVCIMEDDHIVLPGAFKATIQAMKMYYGKVAPNGLLFGLFTACNKCRKGSRAKFGEHLFPTLNNDIGSIGGTNSCFRCAPTSHWNNVLIGYDTDEYLISQYQTRGINHRNYNHGFTTLIVNEGKNTKRIENNGRGVTSTNGKLWDDNFTKSDRRAKHRK